MNRRIRPSVPSEAASISALAFRSKAHWGYSRDFMDACRAELTYRSEDYERLLIYVLETPDIAGFYALEPSPDCFELDALFVDPARIGQGLGKALLEHAIAVSRRHGASRLGIQGDPNAERFYLAAGARRVGEQPSASIPGRMLPRFEISLSH